MLFLPLLFFGTGALIAGLSIRTAKLMAPEPVTLVDAAAVGQDDAIFRMVLAGEDPGLPVVLEHPLIHWKKGEVTSPLLVAIAVGDLGKSAYMARHTRRLADPPNHLALCVAARYGHTNVARFLMKMGVPPVPKDGCGELERPEDVAAKYREGGLSRELRRYRIETR